MTTPFQKTENLLQKVKDHPSAKARNKVGEHMALWIEAAHGAGDTILANKLLFWRDKVGQCTLDFCLERAFEALEAEKAKLS